MHFFKTRDSEATHYTQTLCIYMYITEYWFTLYGVAILEFGSKYIDFLKSHLLGYLKYRHKGSSDKLFFISFTYMLNYL